jgi:ABC-type oligopeptide transport system ATPase subunit
VTADLQQPREQPVYEVRGLEVTLGGRPVLGPLDLQIPSAAFLGVLGPNGSGKTTLLRALAGTVKPSAGEILLLGRPVRQYRSTELARLVGVVPQSSPSTSASLLPRRWPWAATPTRAGGSGDQDGSARAGGRTGTTAQRGPRPAGTAAQPALVPTRLRLPRRWPRPASPTWPIGSSRSCRGERQRASSPRPWPRNRRSSSSTNPEQSRPQPSAGGHATAQSAAQGGQDHSRGAS